jgi:RimJ/RimL family protein N-acetyltransferase
MEIEKLVGKDFYLRVITLNDITEKYVNWLNDTEVNQYLECRFNVATIESVQKYVQSIDNETNFLFGIFKINASGNDQHIGNIRIEVNKHHNTAYFGYMVGDKDYWGTLAATESIILILDFAFNELKVRKLWAAIYLNNISAIFTIKRLGFQQDGRLRKHVILDNGTTDLLNFSILENEWLQLESTLKRHLSL